jgi:ABC-2 type transport system permease protein
MSSVPIESIPPPVEAIQPPRPNGPRVVTALVGRDLRRFFRQPSRVVGSVAQPLILWAVLGAGFADSLRVGVAAGAGYLTYFFPGTIVLAMLFTAIFSTMSVIDDRHHGFLQAVLVAPTSRTALVLGKTLGGVAIALVQAVAFVALAPLAGFSLAGVDFPFVFAVLTATALGFTALGFAVAWWVDSTQGYHGIMSVALLPLWMLSGAMFPPGGSHRWVQLVMRFNPMTYAVAGVRRGLGATHLAGGADALLTGSSAGVELAATTAFSVVAVAIAVAVCRRRP